MEVENRMPFEHRNGKMLKRPSSSRAWRQFEFWRRPSAEITQPAAWLKLLEPHRRSNGDRRLLRRGRRGLQVPQLPRQDRLRATLILAGLAVLLYARHWRTLLPVSSA